LHDPNLMLSFLTPHVNLGMNTTLNPQTQKLG